MERKDFLRRFILGTGLVLTAPLVFNSCSKDEEEKPGNNNDNQGDILVDLNSSAYASLKAVGGYAYTGDIIIARTSDTQYVALSKICTHQNCTVNYAGNQMVCPCHQSKFSVSGSVVQGPATTPLKQYAITVEGNNLRIK